MTPKYWFTLLILLASCAGYHAEPFVKLDYGELDTAGVGHPFGSETEGYTLGVGMTYVNRPKLEWAGPFTDTSGTIKAEAEVSRLREKAATLETKLEAALKAKEQAKPGATEDNAWGVVRHMQDNPVAWSSVAGILAVAVLVLALKWNRRKRRDKPSP